MTETNEGGTPMVRFRAGELQEELAQRGDSWGLIAKRDLARFYTLLAYESSTILEARELAALVEVLQHIGSGSTTDGWDAVGIRTEGSRLLWMGKEMERLGVAKRHSTRKYPVEPDHVVRQIMNATQLELAALRDAIEKAEVQLAREKAA